MLGLGNSLITGGQPEEFTWIPTDIGGLAVWHRNSRDVSASEWEDQSGNANTATQEDESKQAVVSNGGLDFDGESNYYEYESAIDLASDDNFTIAIVYELDDNSVKSTIWSKNAANAFVEFFDADTVRFNYTGTTVSLDGGNHTAGSVRSMIIVRRGSNGAHNLYEGNDTASGSATQTGAAEFNNLGARNDTDRFFNGKIYEVMIWDNVEFKGVNLDNLIQYISNLQNSIE